MSEVEGRLRHRAMILDESYGPQGWRRPGQRFKPGLEWCRDNLEDGTWHHMRIDVTSQDLHGYLFRFDSEEDCFMFRMLHL